MIKAVFFDVDGTLYSHTTGSISESTRRALEMLKKKDIKYYVATGRHMLELQDMPVLDIVYDGYITLNGQLCLDEKKQFFYGKAIDGTEKECLVRLFKEKVFPIMFIEENRMYMNFINQLVIDAQTDISTAIADVEDYQDGNIYMAVAYLPKEEEESLKKQLPGCKITRWNKNAIDIISSTGGKINGIKQYLKQNNWSVDEIMAFGDAENDMEMLAFAKVGVAMGNAEQYVKEHADYVTKSVDDRGVEYALKQYGII